MRSKRGGFTLLEVLISLVILGTTLGLIISLFGGGLRSVRVTEEYSQALQLARGKMVPNLRGLAEDAESEASGELNGYHWERSIRPFATSEEGEETNAADLYEIAVTVRWMEGLKEKTITVQGLEMALEPKREQADEKG